MYTMVCMSHCEGRRSNTNSHIVEAVVRKRREESMQVDVNMLLLTVQTVSKLLQLHLTHNMQSLWTQCNSAV